MAGRAEPATRRENLSGNVYQRLREDIVTGVLRPNEALVEADLAERMGVSRTPVRESMQRLAADGLIVSKRRRWVVYEHSPAEIAELYEIRAGLEAQAARLAAQRLTDDDAGRLEAIRETATSSVLEGDERVRANVAFHDLVSELSRNSRLVEMIRGSRLYHFNRRVATLYSPEDLRVSAEQHEMLIEALLRRDADEAGRVALAHVESALDLILHRLY